MKKLALINLIVLIAIKSVSACDYFNYANDPNYVDPIAKNYFYSKLYFYLLVFLILANIGVYFLRKQKDGLVLKLIIFAALLTMPVTIVGAFLTSSCGDELPVVLKWEVIVFLTLFIFHICLWISKVGLHWQTGKLKLIKYQ